MYMLLNEFDATVKAVINPANAQSRFKTPEILISCFSYVLFDSLVKSLNAKEIGYIESCNGKNRIYEIEVDGYTFGFYRSQVGAPMCTGDFEELIASGCKTLILFGNCGVLDKQVGDCEIIIPNRALRDEGTSYHYMAASDEIEVNTMYYQTFLDICKKHHYPTHVGKTWTTDAFYRETPNKVNRRKQQGAICVEMECSAMAAVARFREVEFFQFLYAGDNLDAHEWDPRSLDGEVKLDEKQQIILLATELAKQITIKKQKIKHLKKELKKINSDVEAWQYGAAPNKLAQLTKEGIKVGTASLHKLYQEEPVPAVGCISIILDTESDVSCVVQTTKVDLLPFKDVTPQHAYNEGEGDRSLTYWREVHYKFFMNEDPSFTEEDIIVCETFKLLEGYNE